MPTREQITEIVLLSKTIPENIILELLSDAITGYLAVHTEETRARLRKLLIVSGLKVSTCDESAEKIIEGIDQVHRFKQMFNAAN